LLVATCDYRMLTHADNKVFFVPQVLLCGWVGDIDEYSWYAYAFRILCVHRSILVLFFIEIQAMKDHVRS
jgi:hypothetical protein